jgi:hypothetical protein
MSYVRTDGQSASLSWHKAPIWDLGPDFYCNQTLSGLLIWGALSDERTGLSFTFVTGARQRSHSRVRVPWDSQPYFTVSDSRLPFLSPPTSRRVTVEVIDPASTRENLLLYAAEHFFMITLNGHRRKQNIIIKKACLLIRCLAMDVLFLRVCSRRDVFIESLPSNGCPRHNKTTTTTTTTTRTMTITVVAWPKAWCLRPLKHWDRGFEFLSRHGCLSGFVLSCVGSGLATRLI